MRKREEERITKKRASWASTVRFLRIYKGLAQRELARKLGIKQSELAKIEQGDRDITNEEIRRFCEFWDISQTRLIALVKATPRSKPKGIVRRVRELFGD